MNTNDQVREYWEAEACGTTPAIVGDLLPFSSDWFERIEEHRYQVEPMIHAAAQFTRWRGKRVLEVGVGAGTDHLQWARAGATCVGVDLTEAALVTTATRFATYGFVARLQRVDAEQLPLRDASFDVVYSWGVIHHAARPEAIVEEARRVLKPGGHFIGMFYGRRSLQALKVWVRHGLLRGRPWRRPSELIWNHVESLGTKAYTERELCAMFAGFEEVQCEPVLTSYDTSRFPRWLHRWLPAGLGWFLIVRAVK